MSVRIGQPMMKRPRIFVALVFVLVSTLSSAFGVAADTIPPTVSVTAPTNNAFVRATITLTATSSDDVGVAGVQFVIDGVNLGSQDATAPYSLSWNTTTTANGVHTVSATARDAAGNSTTSSITVTVDNQPPSGTVVINNGVATTNTRNVVLTLAANDAIGAVTQMRLSNTGTSFKAAMPFASTSPWTLASGGGTTKTVFAQFRDAAGNWSSSATDTIVLDTTAPTVSAIASSNISSSSTTITWATNESATSQVDYGLTTSYGATSVLDTNLTTAHTVTLTNLAPSTTYNYRVRSRDAAGNERVSGNLTFTTTALPDTEAPAVTLTAPAANATVSGLVVLTANATDNVGVIGVQFLVDGVSAAAEDVGFPYSVTWDSRQVSDGSHSLAARARDPAGNVTTSNVISVVVSNGAAVPVTMGETTILSADDSGNGNLLLVQDATLSQTAIIQRISFYVTQASGGLRLGVYDATGPGGGPGTLKAETRTFTATVGWNTENVTTPVLLPAGTYWLAYNPSSSALHFATDFGVGSYRGVSFAFGPSMPTTFPSATLQGTTHWSLFASLESGSSPDSTAPTVSLTAPASNAQVSDIVLVIADASDDVAVVGVQFYVDGIPAGLEDNDAPYALQWDTRTVSNGAHTLTARARDFWGNQRLSDPVIVNVANVNFFQNEVLATGFNLPTNIEFLPDARMLVAELAGTIKVLPPPYTTPDPTPFLQLALNIGGYAGLQQGIFDVALDPNFSTNHFYYVFYTNDSPSRDRLSRFTANATLSGTIPNSEVILFEDPQTPETEHHGGAVNFGNDGKIYFTTGDQFNAANAQNLTNPRGKIHRINADGTIPGDNPFYDGSGPNWDSIWALGLRNPFRAFYDSQTDRLLVADVGGNDYSTAYEEVDLAAAGANYGWPNCEFGTCGNPINTPALYAYPHLGRDASITGGFVYHGTQFPSAYQGSYFFADYTQNWIKRLTFDGNGAVNGVFNFEPANGVNDGPYGDIVYLTEGPDGALYYVDLGYSDVGGTFGLSKIRRIRYLQSNLPPTAIASASPTSGPTPLAVNFSSAGSTDPEGQPITFLWSFGDNSTSTIANPVHTYTQEGQYTARVSVSDGVNTTLGTPFTITVGSVPTATILTPQSGASFRAGDVISFSGDAGGLPASAYVWNIDFLHEGHVHPGLVQGGVTNGTFTIPTSGHDFSGNTRYRIALTVTGANGLQASTSVIVLPQKVNLSFNTLPSALTLYLDGIAKQTPFVYDTLVNFQHSIEARNQGTATTAYTFVSWSDGGAQTHTITVPAVAQSYMATYSVTTSSAPITMGETTVFGSDDSGNGGLLLVQDATLAQTATLQSLSFYVNAAAGNLRLGIYDATGPNGGPGALKAQTNAFAPVVGWNTQSVITPVLLPAGAYWLAYCRVAAHCTSQRISVLAGTTTHTWRSDPCRRRFHRLWVMGRHTGRCMERSACLEIYSFDDDTVECDPKSAGPASGGWSAASGRHNRATDEGDTVTSSCLRAGRRAMRDRPL